MLLKVVFLFYWKKNYFNHCLKSILTKKYCLLIFFFPFLLEILLKKKNRKQWLYTGVCSVPGYFDELYFQKGTSPQPTYITPDFYIPLIYEPSSPSIELYTYHQEILQYPWTKQTPWKKCSCGGGGSLSQNFT